MLLACGSSGLMAHQGGWRVLPCPLPCPELFSRDGGRLAVLDNTVRQVWTGRRVIPVDSGVEAMLLWDDRLLTLSGDTDCLTSISLATGEPLLTIPAGVYPQDMCLLPGGRSLAVCGGADGTLRIIRLPDLWEEQAIRLPGSVQRVTISAGVIYALCCLESDGLCCQLVRIHRGQTDPLAQWDGLPGCLHADGAGRVWIAASEVLCCLQQDVYREISGEFGLIRRMDSRGDALLAADPVMDALWQVEHGRAEILYAGNVQHGVYI